MLPDPVDHHACRQRVIRTRDRMGQLEPAAAVLERRSIAPQDGQKPPRDLGPGVSALPRIKTGMSVGRACVGQGVDHGVLGRGVFLQRSSSALQGFHLGLGFGRQHPLDLLELVSRDLLFQSLGFRLQERRDLFVLGLDRGLGFVVRLDLLLGRRGDFDVFGAGENARQRVVIGCRDRVVLVVVAAGAGDRKPQEAAGQRVDAVGVLVVFLGVAVVDRPTGEKAQGRQAIKTIGPVEQVAGDLLEDEPVVGHVAVQGPDQPVAIAEPVGVKPGLERVGLVLAVACHVEPVAPPPFAVVRRGQQPVDERCECVRAIVLDESLDLLRGRRQPDQVEKRAADQRSLCRPAAPAPGRSPRAWPG